jgi:hypothetical protein
MAGGDFNIPADVVQHAFDILKDKAHEHAKARAAYEYWEKNLKVVLAHAAAKSNASSETQRQQEALRSAEYMEALDQFEEVAAAYFTAKDRRDAASAIISGWQTISADRRQLGKVI